MLTADNSSPNRIIRRTLLVGGVCMSDLQPAQQRMTEAQRLDCGDLRGVSIHSRLLRFPLQQLEQARCKSI